VAAVVGVYAAFLPRAKIYLYGILGIPAAAAVRQCNATTIWRLIGRGSFSNCLSGHELLRAFTHTLSSLIPSLHNGCRSDGALYRRQCVGGGDAAALVY
jgi:hypothetical protein